MGNTNFCIGSNWVVDSRIINTNLTTDNDTCPVCVSRNILLNHERLVEALISLMTLRR